MKNILLSLLSVTVLVPAFAVCKVDEICSAGIDAKSEKQIIKKVQNSQFDLSKDARNSQSFINIIQNADYNSNCQFGICLPMLPKISR